MIRAATAFALVLGTSALAAGDPPVAGLDDARPVPADSKIGADCTLNGKKLYGKWQFVENFPDFTITYVEHFPDFQIKKVQHFPGRP